MEHFISTVLTALTLISAAHAQSEASLQPLGLERAVIIEGRHCTITTPYDRSARCGTERVRIMYCPYPAFNDNRLVCNVRVPKSPD